MRKSWWPSRDFRPNEPYGICGRKATLDRASALVTVCPLIIMLTDIRGHEALHYHHQRLCFKTVLSICRQKEDTSDSTSFPFPP